MQFNFDNTNWFLLAHQLHTVAEIADTCSDKLTKVQIDHLDGLLNLMADIRDKAEQEGIKDAYPQDQVEDNDEYYAILNYANRKNIEIEDWAGYSAVRGQMYQDYDQIASEIWKRHRDTQVSDKPENGGIPDSIRKNGVRILRGTFKGTRVWYIITADRRVIWTTVQTKS